MTTSPTTQSESADLDGLIEREATRAAWMGMLGFFACSLLLFVRPDIAALGMLTFMTVWVGCGIVAIKIRRRIAARRAQP